MTPKIISGDSEMITDDLFQLCRIGTNRVAPIDLNAKLGLLPDAIRGKTKPGNVNARIREVSLNYEEL